jgi:hypothetical protein
LWTPFISKDQISFDSKSKKPLVATKSSLKVAKSKWSTEQKNALITWSCSEKWFLIQGRIITENQLGVGPHDWHSKSAIEELQSIGSPANQTKKGPAFTPSKGGKNSSSKRKRSSNRANRKRAKLFQANQ